MSVACIFRIGLKWSFCEPPWSWQSIPCHQYCCYSWSALSIDWISLCMALDYLSHRIWLMEDFHRSQWFPHNSIRTLILVPYRTLMITKNIWIYALFPILMTTNMREEIEIHLEIVKQPLNSSEQLSSMYNQYYFDLDLDSQDLRMFLRNCKAHHRIHDLFLVSKSITIFTEKLSNVHFILPLFVDA